MFISVGGCVDPGPIVRLKANEKSPGIDFVTFRRNNEATGNCKNVVSSERIVRCKGRHLLSDIYRVW
jgi:hypothetical protein